MLTFAFIFYRSEGSDVDKHKSNGTFPSVNFVNSPIQPISAESMAH